MGLPCITFWDHFTLPFLLLKYFEGKLLCASRAQVSLLPVSWSQCGRARLTAQVTWVHVNWPQCGHPRLTAQVCPGFTLTSHSVDVQGLRSPAARSDLWSALSSQRGLYSWSHEGGNLETWNLLFVVLYFPFLYKEVSWGPMNVIIPLPSTHWLFGIPRRCNTYLETFACSVPSSIFLVELESFYWSQLVNRKIQCFYIISYFNFLNSV